MITEVHLGVPTKILRTLPKHVLAKLLFWVDLVGEAGLEEVRKRPGFHDEPLPAARALGPSGSAGSTGRCTV